ncbi:MAG: hypothetical protein KC656_37080, partial [Myxococcales bacterium]|nr:hypothetical protein [Myxococcales bacterium]
AVTADGSGVYGWRANDYNLLGLGAPMAGAHPTPIVVILDPTSTFDVALSLSHACLLQRTTGMAPAILCAGSNSHFQLGVRVATDPMHFHPVPVFL